MTSDDSQQPYVLDYWFSNATDARILTAFSDFILFKGGNNQVVLEG